MADSTATPLTPSPQPPAAALLSMPEIAALAKVQRPVVSNWKRRYADFPPPVTQVAGQPLFDGEQVADWLIAAGLGKSAPEDLRADLVLHGITAHADRTDPLRTVETLGALLCLRHLDEKPLAADGPERQTTSEDVRASLLHRAERMDSEDEFVLREVRGAGAEIAELARLAEDMTEAVYGERGAYEWLLAARSRLRLPDLTADALAPELHKLLAQLADLPDRIERDGPVTLADPHARTGDLLASLIRESETPECLTALAAERDERLARIARRRLLLAGIEEMELDVQTGTRIEEGLSDPDLVITQLPYQPGEERSALATLEGVGYIADLLGPGCTALVLGPAAALVDTLSDAEAAQFRTGLLREGIVEAVIALPGGLLPYRPGYRPALWVLTRTPVREAEGYVLLVDVAAEELTATVRAHLVEDVLLWRAEGLRRLDGHDPRYGRAVTLDSLGQAFRGPLMPPAPPASQILARRVTERPALIAEAEAQLERAGTQARSYEDATGPYRGNVQHRTGPRPARTTLGKLISQGRVTRVRGHRLDAKHVSAEGGHVVLGPEEVTGRATVGERRIDRLVLADKYEQTALTRPGDLIYTLAPELGLYVDPDGYGIAAFPARILRVNPDAEHPLTPRVLAALLGAARGTGRSPGAVRPSRRIEDYQLPDLSPSDVIRFDALMAEAERREQLLRAQADALAEAKLLTVAGLADGTLTIGPAIGETPDR
ncbi:hypothetical protein ACH4SP_20890 [Streptomyces sp. NPDC021093]|uniref:hypothetical protein n=1 Tax=Streptomyces sp. NPDC021093 TaxID=3365112 RepID=UPI0037BC9024